MARESAEAAGTGIKPHSVPSCSVASFPRDQGNPQSSGVESPRRHHRATTGLPQSPALWVDVAGGQTYTHVLTPHRNNNNKTTC